MLTMLDKIKLNDLIKTNEKIDLSDIKQCVAKKFDGKEVLLFYIQSIKNKNYSITQKTSFKYFTIMALLLEYLLFFKTRFTEGEKEMMISFLKELENACDYNVDNNVNELLRYLEKFEVVSENKCDMPLLEEKKEDKITEKQAKKNEAIIKKQEQKLLETQEALKVLRNKLTESQKKQNALEKEKDAVQRMLKIESQINASLTQQNECLVVENNEMKGQKQKIDDLDKKLQEKNLKLEESEIQKKILNSQNEALRIAVSQNDAIFQNLEKLTHEKLVVPGENRIRFPKEDANEIYNFLFQEVSLNEIRNYCRTKGKFYSLDDLSLLIRDFQKHYQISSQLNLPVTYKLSSALFESDKIIKINSNPPSFFKALFVSDFHLRILYNERLKSLDKIYNYCVQNNITSMINLGDFFDFDRTTSYLWFEEFVKMFLEKYPRNEALSQYILGGNHDEIKIGKEKTANILDIISKERSDIFYMGSTHAFLNFGNDFIGLHHIPKRLLFTEGKSSNMIQERLNVYYENVNGKLPHPILDILGHFHKDYQDLENGLLSLPSLFQDRFQNGFYEIEFYLNEKNEIEYIIFKPFIINHGIISQKDEIFQRVLKK